MRNKNQVETRNKNQMETRNKNQIDIRARDTCSLDLNMKVMP